MTLPMAAWRVTYTPGDWLVLSGPTMLVVMPPAPARMSQLVNTLWDGVVAARSVDALLALFGEYGLDGMPDFGAFFWDSAGLHAMARGRVNVVDTETGDTAVSGSDVVTWREEALGATRYLRVDMQSVESDESLQLPLVVGAVTASAIYLTTDPASQVRFPDREHMGVLPRVSVLGVRPADNAAEAANEVVADVVEEHDEEIHEPVQLVGLGDETDMEPYEEPAREPVDGEPVDHEAELDGESTQFLRFDADDVPEPDNDPGPPAPATPLPMGEPAVPMPTPAVPIPPPAGPGPAAVPGNFQVGDDDLGGTIFSVGLAATHKPPAAVPPEQPQVLAVPCARGHANAPGSRLCRMCSAPVDSSNPRLINRPALAGVHSTTGEFANLHIAVLIGRSPDAAKAPQGAHLMRVASPSSDISRSHIIVTPRDWSVIVTDLDSTNGTTIIPTGEQPFVLANGESVQVDLGTVLDLGEGVSVRIEPPRG